MLDVEGTWRELTGVVNKLAANLTNQVIPQPIDPLLHVVVELTCHLGPIYCIGDESCRVG